MDFDKIGIRTAGEQKNRRNRLETVQIKY